MFSITPLIAPFQPACIHPAIFSFCSKNKIGAQSAVSTPKAIDEFLVNIASELSGVTMEELQAYKNSFAADWNKNSILLPIDKWKKGQGKAINFSYFSPYDVVQKPFEAFKP